MKTFAFVFLLTAHLVAQNQNTGPFTPTNRVAWYMADGATATAAQAYEARVQVDGTAISYVLPGVTCLATTLTDPAGAVWSFGAGQAPSLQVLRNGTPVAGIFGAKLSIVSGVLYLQGDDYAYYRWTGTTFPLVTSVDPAPAVIDAAAASRWNCSAPPTSTLIRALNVVGPHTMALRIYDTTAKVESLASMPFGTTTPVSVMVPIQVRIVVR